MRKVLISTALAGATLGALVLASPVATATGGGNVLCEEVPFGDPEDNLFYQSPPPANGWDDTGKNEDLTDFTNQYVDVTFMQDGEGEVASVTVTPIEPAVDDFVIGAVIVKGGSDQAEVYTEPPFEGLTAPDGKGISNIRICVPPDVTPPTTEPPTEPPTEEPTDEPTEEPTEPPSEKPEPPAGGGEEEPEEDALPDTGGSSNGALLAAGGLLALGGAAFAGRAVLAARK